VAPADLVIESIKLVDITAVEQADKGKGSGDGCRLNLHVTPSLLLTLCHTPEFLSFVAYCHE
jgi:hypothetical protein